MVIGMDDNWILHKIANVAVIAGPLINNARTSFCNVLSIGSPATMICIQGGGTKI